MSRLAALFLRALLVVSLCGATSALAQPAGTLGEDFLYRVQEGDTLIGLAQRYLRNSQAWRPLQTLNQVEDPYRMPIGMTLRIPLAWIPREAAQARLAYVRGPVRVGAASARADEALAPGSVLYTGEGGSAALALEDGTLITLVPNTELHIEHLSKFQGSDLGDTVIDLSRGALEATVAPSGQGVGRFEVRTPVAVTGVRGTRFRTERGAQGQMDAVTHGSLRLQPRTEGGAPETPTLIQEGYGSVVRADGTLAGSWPLLPAPTVSEPTRLAGHWQAHITPVAGATRYELVVAHDANGHFQFASELLAGTDIRVALPGTRDYYLIVQALDERGLRGHATHLLVQASRVLRDSRGEAVLNGTGEPILLTDA